jgi:hypothetical protein
MIRRAPLLVLALAGLLPAGGCLFSQGDSCDATIEGISLDADVYNDDDGDQVARASFEFGDMSGIGGTSLELCGSDALHINGEAAREWEDPITNRLYYTVTFDDQPDEYEFVFSRDGEDDVVATVVQPPPFEPVSPEDQEQLSRADGLTIEWDPSASGNIHVELDPEEDSMSRSCLAAQSDTVEDSGVYEYLPQDLELPAGDDKIEQCRVEIRLEREAVGEYPEEFDNGSIRAYQRRSVEFISVP